VQAPSLSIDAPKPVTESRIGSGHPGKPIFLVDREGANQLPGRKSQGEFGSSLKSQ
jgi:hypothetical protein